jgi:XTP/dITP diphosphohydrolase
VVLATGNPGKVEELRHLLAPLGVAAEVRPLPELPEDAPDYVGNALIKARGAAAATGLAALGDDVGLEVAALDGGPGLRTRRWAEERGGWAAARAALGSVAGSRATFWCAMALCLPDGTARTGVGRVDGVVGRGRVDGAGLEPCFVAEGTDRSLSELDAEVRRGTHHRCRAFDALLYVWRS